MKFTILQHDSAQRPMVQMPYFLNSKKNGSDTLVWWANASGNFGIANNLYAAAGTFTGGLTATVITSKTTADPLSGERDGLKVADTAGSVIFKTTHKSHGSSDAGNFDPILLS